MRLLLATTNPGKLREIREIFGGLPIELLTLDQWPDVEAPAETGETFVENARLKAVYYATATGELTVADDSGLAIDAMEGAPGVHSARFGGADATYAQRFDLIRAALRAKGQIDSPARFVCALALAQGDQIVFETQAAVEGRIAPEARGTGGFGYDPIFFYPPFGTTLAEAADRKSAVSHRGQAFRALRDYLVSTRWFG